MKLKDFVWKTELNLKDFSTVVVNDDLGQIDTFNNVEECLHYEGDATLIDCWRQQSLFDQNDILFFLVDEMV